MPDKTAILFIGDIIGKPGRSVLGRFLPELKKTYNPDLVIANGENAAGGIGITEDICRELLEQVDVLTTGNHVWDKRDGAEFLSKEPRLLRPANYPDGNPGTGEYVSRTSKGIRIAVLNLQGRVFMEAVDCPFRCAENRVAELRNTTPLIIVDFHAEATSEKQALGWYLDGKATAVLGTHTHVPTADDKILPGGTAYLTDVGMAGGYHSVIGIKKEQALLKFLTARPQRFEPDKGKRILSYAYIEADVDSGRALVFQRGSLIEENDG